MSEAQGTSRSKEHAFQADVNQVLDIVIHSLYSHREIFLRELISNAADALDKLRVRALTESGLMEQGEQLQIRLIPNAADHTLTIADNGIGMVEDEMVENLGTIAHSGSKAFLEAMKQQENKAGEVELIGQFGVGFYSSFLVADKVEVTSLAATAAGASRWTSEAKGSYTVEPAPDKQQRGTEIKLHLGEEHHEFLEEYRLRELVRKYSDFVGHPILLLVEREEVERDEEGNEREGAEKKKVQRFEPVNQASALWTRPKEEITEEQYEEFYRHLTHDWEKPLAHKLFRAEGTRMFTGLLYLPSKPPFDLFDRDHRRGVRLYVKRVFIMDDCKELLPEWLRFVRGVIDSDDLPLNVSRELLQEDKTVQTIRKVVVRRSIDLIEELSRQTDDDAPEGSEDAEGEDGAAKKTGGYRQFWDSFGAVLKEGLHYDADQRERLAELVRYDSSHAEFSSLKEYVERMPEGQDAIYYVLGPNRQTVENSPHIESLKKKGYEVLFMTDTVDEWAVHGLEKYDDKPLVSAMKADLDLDEDDEVAKKEQEAKKEVYEGFTTRIGEVLEDTVSEVRISRRLTDSPACLVVPEGGMHAHIERMLRAQQAGMPPQKRIFEINPDHPIVQKVHALHEAKQRDQADDWVRLLHDQALLAEGSPLPDAPGFAKRMAKMMENALGS